MNFDLWPGNILLDRKENGRYFISGILDFERCFYGDPKGDFIASVMILDDAQKEEAFLRGYRQITGTELTFTERDQIRMDLYRVYLLLNLGIETYRFEPEYAAQTLKRVETQLNIVLDRLS